MTWLEIVLIAACVVAALLFVGHLIAFPAWMEAKAANLEIGLSEILGMRLRRTDPRIVIRAAILAKYGKVPVDLITLEAHTLAGGRPDGLVAAFIEAQKRGVEVSLDDLARAELSGSSPSRPPTEVG